MAMFKFANCMFTRGYLLLKRAFFIMLTPLVPADSQPSQVLGTSTLFGGYPAREPTRNVGHFIEKP